MRKKRTQNDLNLSFKDKEKERGERRSQFGGQWKVPMFGDLWKVLLILKLYFTMVIDRYLHISFLFLNL